jgi:flagellar hook-length control protein FliK
MIKQKMGVGPEKPAPTAHKPRDNPAPTSREPKPNLGGTAKQIFSDSVHGKQQAGNPSGKLLPWQFNATESTIAGSQPKNRSRLTWRQASSTHFTRAISSDNTHISVSELRSASSQPIKVTNTTLPMDVSSTVSQQIMESIHGSLQQGDRYITIRLHPPELGKVVVRFQEREDQITGSLEVSKAQTRYEIDQALPQIIQTLRDSGVRIERLDVLLTDQSERQADKNHLLQDGSFQQHYSAEGNNSDNKSNYERLTERSNRSYQDDPELQVQIDDNSINMLI